MKVKVIARAYYNDSLVNAGDIIDLKGKKLPSWATLLDGIETKKNKEKEIKDDNKVPEGAPVIEAFSPEREEYLNKLICEGIEKGILIEDSDKKTVEEQIKELEEALKEKGE